MKVGDEIVYINKDDYGSQSYTLNKHYKIYKIEPDFIPGCICGWIFEDNGQSVYFRDTDQDKNWEYFSLKYIRKQKLENLCSLKD